MSPRAATPYPLLLQTKLYPPLDTEDLVARPHLLDRLNQGLKRTLTLISAPAGFGKTTLAGQWLLDCDRSSVWLSLDEGDNQLPKFLSYFCAAVRRSFPEACGSLRSLLDTANLPGQDYVADLLIEELDALPTELILVLDDYHHIDAPDVHQVMRRLLRYRPAQLHLVIITRADPPLSLGRLRTRDQITEIRAADLRFVLDETRRFLWQPAGPSLDEQVIHALQERTEGWVTGLQVAGLYLQHQPPTQLLSHFGGSHQPLAGYLVEEVLADLPAAVHEFLLRTSLLDRFCPPLGDALLVDTPWPASSQTTIAWLEMQNMFIVSLDSERIWYRYHDLFRDFLQHRLKHEKGSAEIAELHRQAGAWLAEDGQIEDALRHTLAAGDKTAAADLVETNLHPLLNQQASAPVLKRWLDLFPDSVIQNHPGLLIARFYLFATTSVTAKALATTVDRIAVLMQEQDAGSTERRQQRMAILDMLQGYVCFSQGDASRAIQLSQRGLANIADLTAYSFTCTHAFATLALAYAYCGEGENALTVLRQVLEETAVRHSPSMLILLGTRARIHLYAGELAAAARAAKEILTWIDAIRISSNQLGTGIVQVWRGWAHYYLGTVHYEQNDLKAAATHWQQVEAARYEVHPTAFHASLFGLACIAQAQREAVKALAYAQAAREFAVEICSPFLLECSVALDMRLAMRDDAPADALLRIEGIDTTVNQGISFLLQPSCLTVLQAHLAEGRPTSLATARHLAETRLCQAETAHNTRQVIQIAALQALIWHALCDTECAINVLHRALTLAEPGKFIRVFLDLGSSMTDLLQQYAHQCGSTLYVQRLLAAFAGELDSAGQHARTAQYVALHHITPLTPRELELLTLVGQRLTVNEMAERLVISPNTVKKHVSNIYSKLGVKKRRDAIAKANEVGLLPPA